MRDNYNIKIGVLQKISLAILISILAFPGFVLAEAGIASKYIGDKGIENDPDVIFAENFETGAITDIPNRYNRVKNIEGMSFAPDVPSGSSGTRSLQMTTLGGANPAGYLYKRLSAGYDQLYFRYYVKYTSGGTYSHTSGWIGGYNPPLDGPNPQSGIKPTGSDRFLVAAEPDSADPPFTDDGTPRFDSYIYWMGMRVSSDGINYWGNDFINNANIKTTLDKWMCVEVMVKLNNPVDSHNGELAIWIDGKKISHLGEGFPNGNWVGNSFFPDTTGSPFEGFQWRNVQELKLNWIWIQHYVANALGDVSRVWYDDVVVATKYIGPINTLADIPSPPTGLKIQ